MEKRVFAVAMGLLLCGGMVHAVDVDVDAKMQKYKSWGAGEMVYNKQALLTAPKNFYAINFLQTKPNKDGVQRTCIHMSSPKEFNGFARAPIDFFGMTVNGINLSKIQPRENDFRIWKTGDTAGAEFVMNFDGVKVLVQPFMKKNSQLLFLKFTQPEKQITPIKSITLSFSCVVSRLKTKNNVTVWQDAYKRQAQSATRTLEQRKEPYELTAADKYLILRDNELDGSDAGKSKGNGPSYLTFDFSGVKSARLNLRNEWITWVTFELKPDFKSFTVGLWERKNPISNAEFPQMFSKNAKEFSIE